MKELILVRHGETAWNAERRYQGHTDIELSEIGIAQARALAPRFTGFDQENTPVYSSDLKRAVQTAAIVCPWATPILDPRLREIKFGKFEGLTYDQNIAQHGDAFANWMGDPELHSPLEGESVREMHARLLAWAAELPQVPHVIAFAHGGVLRSFASHTRGRLFTSDLSIPPTAVLSIILNEKGVPIGGSESWW